MADPKIHSWACTKRYPPGQWTSSFGALTSTSTRVGTGHGRGHLQTHDGPQAQLTSSQCRALHLLCPASALTLSRPPLPNQWPRTWIQEHHPLHTHTPQTQVHDLSQPCPLPGVKEGGYSHTHSPLGKARASLGSEGRAAMRPRTHLTPSTLRKNPSWMVATPPSLPMPTCPPAYWPGLCWLLQGLRQLDQTRL